MIKKQEKKFKSFIALQKRRSELFDIFTSNPFLPIEEPYRHGWNKTWTLRKDIASRKDAKDYWDCLGLVNSIVWCRSKSFSIRTGKGKFYILKPKLKSISEKKFASLSDRLKKFFFKELDVKSNTCYYSCNLTYEIEEKVSRNYITHERKILPDVESEIDFIRSKTYSDFIAEENRFYSSKQICLNAICKEFESSFRRKVRDEIKKIKSIEDCEDFDYSVNYKHRNNGKWKCY